MILLDRIGQWLFHSLHCFPGSRARPEADGISRAIVVIRLLYVPPTWDHYNSELQWILADFEVPTFQTEPQWIHRNPEKRFRKYLGNPEIAEETSWKQFSASFREPCNLTSTYLHYRGCCLYIICIYNGLKLGYWGNITAIQYKDIKLI